VAQGKREEMINSADKKVQLDLLPFVAKVLARHPVAQKELDAIYVQRVRRYQL
jgi:hypothetical protein